MTANSKKQYFLISLDHLPENKEIFSFNLHIYNPVADNFSLFLNANSPLTKDKREFIRLLQEKSGSLAIDLKQKRTFLFTTGNDPKKIPGLTPYEKHPLEKVREIYLAQQKQKKAQREHDPYLYKIELKRALVDNNFTELIQEVHDEVMTYPLDQSATTSLAVYLTDELLKNDNDLSRIAVLCFIIAKELKIRQSEILSELLCSCYLFHLGLTQLNRSLFKVPYMHLAEKNKSYYRRHAGLTQHLLKKINLEISPNVIEIILTHHERIDGNGYPYMKQEASISLAAQILGITSHLFDYSSGRVNGQKIPLPSAISQVILGTNSPGLEKNFSTSIIEVLESIYKVTPEQLAPKGDRDGPES